jgi:hypothetical protein
LNLYCQTPFCHTAPLLLSVTREQNLYTVDGSVQPLLSDAILPHCSSAAICHTTTELTHCWRECSTSTVIPPVSASNFTVPCQTPFCHTDPLLLSVTTVTVLTHCWRECWTSTVISPATVWRSRHYFRSTLCMFLYRRIWNSDELRPDCNWRNVWAWGDVGGGGGSLPLPSPNIFTAFISEILSMQGRDEEFVPNAKEFWGHCEVKRDGLLWIRSWTLLFVNRRAVVRSAEWLSRK